MSQGFIFEERVATPEGWEKTGDLDDTRQVYDETGNPVDVLKVEDLGEQDVYVIHFSDGRTAQTTAKQKWALTDQYENREVVKTTDELLTIDLETPRYTVPFIDYIKHEHNSYEGRTGYLLKFFKKDKVEGTAAVTIKNTARADKVINFATSLGFYIEKELRPDNYATLRIDFDREDVTIASVKKLDKKEKQIGLKTNSASGNYLVGYFIPTMNSEI